MSEGTAVPYVRRWSADLMAADDGFDGVRVSYQPINLQDFVSDSGRVEAVYWRDWTSDVEVRAFKGDANVKYREEAISHLMIEVILATHQTADDTNPSTEVGAICEQRAAEILGEVVKIFQANQPSSPGAHLTNIAVYVEGWSNNPELLTRGGTRVPGAAIDVSVNIKANVEQ